jgi:death-on-curing protein
VKRVRWLDRRALLLLHSESLAEHGGLIGLRDENALDAALARPQHILRYEPKSDLARLAAAYGFGLIKNHPFADGNKRAGFLAMLLFLDLNRHALEVEQVEAIQVIFRVAAGKMREAELAEWIRSHTRKA